MKKNIRMWLVSALMMCFTGAYAQIDSYKLSIADVEGAAGKNVSIPVYLANSGAVTAVQFDIDLPYPMPSEATPVLSNRVDGHSVSVRCISSSEYIYRVFVMSFENKPIQGNSGLLMHFPMSVDAEAQADDSYDVTLTDVIISDVSGDQVASETRATSTFVVQRVPTPDLLVTNLVCGNSVVTPGEAINLTYTIANQGNASTKGSWTEKVYFVSPSGSRLFVGSTVYSNELVNGTTIDRQVAFTLPQVVKVDGDVTVQIELETRTSTTGELIADMANNSTIFEDAVKVEKLLFLNNESYEIIEGAEKKTKMTLTRSGDWSVDETFALSLDVDGVLDYPKEVTIPAQQSGVSFYVYAPDNEEVNESERTHLTVTDKMGGYPDLVVPVKVVDDDDDILSITTDNSEYTEGDDVVFTVTRVDGPVDGDLEVSLTNDYVSRFTVDRSIVIPIGERSATFTLKAKDNTVAQADATVTEVATAPGYETAKVSFKLYDNDRPDLTLKLSTDKVSEADGYACVIGTVTRSGDLTHSVSIYIDNNSDGSVYFDSDRAVIPAGKSSVTFPIGVTDNSTTEGDRVYDISATVYLPECKCAADDKVVKTTLTVTDDDSDAKLQMQSASGMIVEGSYATVTVSRNTWDNLSSELVVNLSSNDETLTLPATVTIPANKKTATFTVKASKDDVVGNTHYSSIFASAEGFSGTSIMFTINDATLPDIKVMGLNVVGGEIIRGSDATFEVLINNAGTTTLPAGVEVPIYYTYSSSWNEQIKANELLRFTTDKEIPAGKTVEFISTARVPWNGLVGTYNIYAWPNIHKEVDEANVFNNISSFIKNVKILAPYKVLEVATDKKVYSKGETLVITGKVEGNLDNEDMNVEVYLVNQNTGWIKEDIHPEIDANGNFTCAYVLGENIGGRYNVGARFPEADTYDVFAQIEVYNVAFTNNYYQWSLTENEALEGSLQVKNTSASAISNVTVSWDNLPEGYEAKFESISKLEAGATGSIGYKIVSTIPSNSNGYSTSEIKVSCAEGVNTSTIVYYRCSAARSNIVIDNPELNTTLKTGSVRSYDVEITNAGLKETGAITLEIPSSTPWLGCTTPTTLPSLAQGESHTLSLQFIYSPDMLVGGTYKSYVKIKSENGVAKVLDVNLTIVATEKGHLAVDVVDVYTKATTDGNGPHVKDATVRIVNAVNGEEVAIGTTGEDGVFAMDLNEGVYNIYASADNHYKSQATVVVGPEENVTQEIFLPFAAVNISYLVEETTVVDEYEVTLEMAIVPDVPQAVVTTNWTNASCGDNTYSVRMTNQGKLVALNPYLELPIVNGVTFEVLNEYPQKIYPGESYEMKVRVIAPDEMQNEIYSYKIKYAFTIQGETYTHTDGYKLNIGCKYYPLLIGGGGFNSYEDESGGGPIPTYPNVNDEDDLLVEEGAISTPTYTPLKGAKDSKVVLQFKQSFFLTRQAFRGTMTLENAQNTALEDVVLKATVHTMDDVDVTELFALDYETPINMKEGDAGWDIEGGVTGEANVVYVPSKEVALTEPTKYKFGGTVTYYDVATETEATVTLTPTVLTVNPSPDLHLTYFVQRKIKGDNLFTEDVVEPWEPVEFALLVNNEGEGDAINLVIETSEPTITENHHNLPIKFETLYSSIDGVPGLHSFEKLDLGKIEAGRNKLARWFFKSSLSGYVADYNAQMTKCSNYGEEFNLITLDGVRDLTRSISNMSMPVSAVAQMRTLSLTPAGRKKNLLAEESDELLGNRMNTEIFLLDDIEDAEGLPDYVMLADGSGTDDLEIVSETSKIVSTSGDVESQYVCELEVEATRPGWVYGVIQDPTNGTMQLDRVVRNDGVDMGSNNFWLSSYKILDDNSMINANELYFADYISGTSATYTLTFTPKPQEALTVVKVEGVPETETTEAVSELTITFNKAIEESTFTVDDLTLICQSTIIDLNSALITKLSDTQYKVDLHGLTPMYGSHILTISTNEIKDVDGGKGEVAYSVEWSQAISGTALLTIEVTPQGAGNVTPSTGEVAYGAVTLKAEAANGYAFAGWSENGVKLSSATLLNYDLYKPTTITAQFVANMCDVTLEKVEGGTVAGVNNGTYEYGTKLSLKAVAYRNYEFMGWQVNGETYADASSEIALEVTGATIVKPVFIYVTPETPYGSAITSLSYQYEMQEFPNAGRQDIILNWEKPSNYYLTAITGYNIYKDDELVGTASADDKSFVIEGLNTKSTFMVVPLFDGLAEDIALGASVVAEEVKEGLVLNPMINKIDCYDDYCVVQVYFQTPSYSAKLPISYNIYRDGELLATDVMQLCFIDNSLHQNVGTRNYTYVVEAVYDDASTCISEAVDVTVTARDWANTGYRLEELYNVEISNIENAPKNFANVDYYSQGHFFNGSWYIAQQSDQLSEYDQEIKIDENGENQGSIRESGIDGASGGVVVINAREASDVQKGVVNKVVTTDEFASVGLAVDNAGTIFVRKNDEEKLYESVATRSKGWTYMPEGFDRRITAGYFYTRKADGTYSTTPTEIDLTPLWSSDLDGNGVKLIDEIAFIADVDLGQVVGRSDYYYMSGDVMSDEGGYLMFSPSWTRAAIKVRVKGGKMVLAETKIIQFADYTEWNEFTNQYETHSITGGAKNYCFEIAGRDTWTAQIQSNACFGIETDNNNSEWKAIYGTQRGVNNVGGTSIVAFGDVITQKDIDSNGLSQDELGKNSGETFLIMPIGIGSSNQGDFMVTRGVKEKVLNAAEKAVLTSPMPVAQFKQFSSSRSIATNANGSWFHAEEGNFVDEKGNESKCVYIYQYVPGIRFAKYRLSQEIQLPVVDPTLDIATEYNEDRTEITHFSGKSTWKRPQGFGSGKNKSKCDVVVDSYTFELLDANSNVVYSEVVPEVYDEMGCPPSDDFEYAFDYVKAMGFESPSACNLDFQTYTAKVTVNYKLTHGGKIQASESGTAQDCNKYNTAPVEDVEVFVYKQNAKNNDVYRLELDFNAPSWEGFEEGSNEPVSYYTVKAKVNGMTETIDISNFNLHCGSIEENGIVKANTIVTSKVPGTYDFSNDKAPYYSTGKWSGGESHRITVLTWHHSVAKGAYPNVKPTRSVTATTIDGNEIIVWDSPENWQFIVEAHYAASNSAIQRSESASKSTGEGAIITNVDIIGADNYSSLHIFPIPAHTTISINSPEAINQIVVFNEAGSEVMNIDGNGENVAKVNVEKLTTGYYFVKVNDFLPVKMIKR